MAEYLFTVLLFFGTTLGLGWPVAARLALEPGEKLGVAVALSLIGVWLIAWAVYVFVLPTGLLWVVPVLGGLNLLLGRKSFVRAARSVDGEELLVAQAIVTASSVGWLAVIVSYSGGDWVGDWFGHWDRARFFLERGPRDILFTGFDPLTSRPPLANVVTGAFLHVTRIDFAHYQLVTTLLNSLAFLPVALLARRFQPAAGSGAATGVNQTVRLLAVLVMLNPLFVQNTTYAWTKLVTAFYVLTGLYFFLRTRDADPPRSAGPLCGACLAAGVITHYSAGP